MIKALPYRFDVKPIQEQLERHPGVWDRYTLRTQGYAGTPHKTVSDVWVRFRDWAEWDGDGASFANTAHKSVWYPCVHEIPAAWSLARRMYRAVGGKRLGGVLITRIPAGGEVRPHSDHGWHAQFYSKFAVQIRGNKQQAFCFDDSSLSALPGETYTFDNSKTHWVVNPSDEDRITLIVCIRT